MKWTKMTWLLLAFFMFSVFAPVNYAAAYTAAEAAAELTNIYKYVDENDKQSIRDARTKAQALTDTELDGLTNTLVNELSTAVLPEFDGVDEPAQRATVQAELRTCFRDLAVILYSEDNLESILADYKEDHTGTFQKLFGNEFTIDDLYELLLAIQEELPSVIQGKTEYFDALESGSDAELLDEIPNIAKDAADNVLDLPEYSDFATRLNDINWNTQMLVDTYIAICGAVDDVNGSAELALVKAAVRSQMHLYQCDDSGDFDPALDEIAADELGAREVIIQPGQAYFCVYVGNPATTGRNATQWVMWDSTQVTIDDSYPSGQGTTLEVTVVSAGSTGNITAYRDAGLNGDPAKDWLLKFDVKVEGDEIGTISGTISIPESETTMAGLGDVNVILVGTAISALTDEDGDYSLTNVPAGTYTLRISKPDYLTIEQSITITADISETVNLTTYLWGDVNADSHINVSDATAIIRNFVNETSLIIPAVADVNEDGYVNISDATSMIRYFVQAVPLPVNVPE
jgi:hypothetical protein